MFPSTRVFAVILPLCVALTTGCSNGSNDPASVTEPETAAVPFQELYDQGVDRYLGRYAPMLSETEGEVVTYTFGAGDGPLCLDGSEYHMATRDKGSDELVIFLQGGGACWPGLCLATENASKGIPKLGLLDPAYPRNPVAGWNTVYLPYCDGGLHISDRDSDSNGDGQPDRFQRGLHNLSAALDVARNTFPSPSRILLIGVSAGGFGTTYSLPLVRKLYPDVPIEVVNDSGLGIVRPDQPEFVEFLLDAWNARAFLPPSCPTCIGEDGHLTDVHKWELEQDPNVRLGMLSYTRDNLIAVTFTQTGLDAFEAVLKPELADIESAFPERMHSWVPDGEGHTFLLSSLELTAGGVSAIDWVRAMLDGSPDWKSASD